MSRAGIVAATDRRAARSPAATGGVVIFMVEVLIFLGAAGAGPMARELVLS